MQLDTHGVPAQVGRFAGAPQRVDYTGTAARSTVLKPNTIYRLYFTTAAFFFFGGSGVVAVASTHHPVSAGGIETHKTDDTNLYVSAVQASSGGSLFISEIALD